jgi:hypothetical protein
VAARCGSALRWIAGEQWRPPHSGHAARRFYFPSEHPAKILRASGIDRFSSPATDKGFRDVSVLGIAVPGECMGLFL